MNNKVKSEQKLNLKKNQEISLTIEDFTKEGEGLGKYQGFPFFVKDTVIGDEVRANNPGYLGYRPFTGDTANKPGRCRNCNTIKRQSNPAMFGRKTVWRL